MHIRKTGKFFMGLLLAMICFCLGLLLMMDKVDACLVEEESVEPEVERVVPLVLEEKVSNKQMQAVPVPMVYRPVLLRRGDAELYRTGYDSGYRIGGTAMSKKEPRAAGMAAPVCEDAASEKNAVKEVGIPVEPRKHDAKTGPVVYCGPSVRGVARQ